MTREELIGYCRYYKGEEECPFTTGIMAWFWDMECKYVNLRGEFEGERGYYEALSGKKYSRIPYQLLIIMFTSWGKWTYDIKNSIGSFYELVDEYLFIPNHHFPEDKIPPEGFKD